MRQESLGTATAFLACLEGRNFLVTNYHVAAGRHPGTGEVLHPTGAVPDRLVVEFVRSLVVDRVHWLEIEVPVLGGDDAGPLWLEHPEYGRQVDVVAIPLTGTRIEAICEFPYDLDPQSPEVPAVVAGDVGVVGFPFGRSGGGALGIWSRGSIATEPAVDFSGLPLFLIDCRTREGPSGSPVILYRPEGNYMDARGNLAWGGEPLLRLLGVYSGRIHPESDLGMVWRTDAVRAIAAGGVRGGSAPAVLLGRDALPY